MNTSPRYRALLRTLFASIIGSRLSAREIRALAEELRRGRLADELAYMLDQTIAHLGGDSTERPDQDIVSTAERLVKQQKISKSALINIMQSLGGASLSADSTIRSMLESFFAESSPAKANKLLEVLAATGARDDFLVGISNSRK